MKEKIHFKKQRDIGEIITDTFKFIREEWKPLGTMILKIAGPALLVMVIAASVYTQSSLDSFGVLEVYGTGTGQFTSTFAISVIVLIIAAVAYFSLLYGTVLNYVKSYVENNGVAIPEEVSTGVRTNFWSLIGLGIVIGLLTGLGLVFCIIPGIYVGVTLATAYAIHIFQKRDVGDTVSYSFNFIKNEWWMTFATYFVIYLIYYIVTLIFQVPLIIYTLANTFAVMDQVSGNPDDIFDWVYTALNAIALIAQYLLQTVLVIGTAFVFYNLNEKKNFTGTIETIDTIGSAPRENA